MIRFEDPDTGKSEYWYDAADVAKYINIENPETGKIIGRNKFLQMLRYNGYILKDSNQPAQNMIVLNLMRWHMVKRRYYQFGMTIFHERALAYFLNRIEDGRITVAFEKLKDTKPQGLSLDEIY